MTAFSEFDRLLSDTGMPLLFSQFGVPVTYFPVAGGQCGLTAMLDYSQVEDQETEDLRIAQEVLWATIRKDPGKHGGGVAAPAIGDGLEREDDDSTTRWSFQGVIDGDSGEAWRLKFARNRPKRFGPKTTL